MRVEFHPEARSEFRLVAIWYDERRAGLGHEFVAAINGVLDRVAGSPRSFPIWPRLRSPSLPIRMATVPRFPYVVAFEQHEDRLIVLAVAHQKRRPLYWLHRASGKRG